MLNTRPKIGSWLLCLAFANCSYAADLIRITPENYQQIVPAGKETDAIHGDWLLRNDKLSVVIAQPQPGRKANMTVRGVSGMIIDFTRRHHPSDQLSCFYPAAGRYLFEESDRYEVKLGDEWVGLNSKVQFSAKKLELRMVGRPVADDGTEATVVYSLADGEESLRYRVQLTNKSETGRKLAIEDSIRCDGNLFEMASVPEQRLFYAVDRYFGQGYGFILDEGTISDGGGRNRVMRSSLSSSEEVASGESVAWSGQMRCSQGLPGLLSWAEAEASSSTNRIYPMQLKLQSPFGPVQHASVEFQKRGKPLGGIQSNEEGWVRTELLPGEYSVKIQAPGLAPRVHEFVIEQSPHSESLTMPACSLVRASIVDDLDRPIAAKVQFIGIGDTPTPDFGPDSAISAIKNCVYSAHGQFEQPIDPGKYQVIVSHGTEYDAAFLEIEVKEGQIYALHAALARPVNSEGWISSDFHSHSSPSGDNVSHQRGRVLNLLAENIEFAPCTEHNRIDTYADDLEFLKATLDMATCTGMELTGSPLPINHQNAFPLHRHEHEQDGGGPETSVDPVAQIERLALWDNSAAKVVQTNHPNIPQILGDRDLDGKPDEGFRAMLGWMDVIEVHPPELIFTPPPADVKPNDKFGNAIFGWMQLLNLGYRIPGVVNTDAHYNFHGSGWLRNYMASSTDSPAEISIEEMVHCAEHGHMIMTTGPFLEAEVRTGDGGNTKRYISGDDVQLAAGEGARVWIRVQCPNWFDVNRVQVFANGRPLESHNFTRQTQPKYFTDQTVRFEIEAPLPEFDCDTHIIVATIGEGLKLGPVMGEKSGELPPVAVANPIFLDVDGSGFQANGDDLGVPFMLPELKSESEDH